MVGCGAGVAAALDGKVITVDGGTGEVFEGVLELTAWSEDDHPDLLELTAIARRCSAVANAKADQTDVCDSPLIAMLTKMRLAHG